MSSLKSIKRTDSPQWSCVYWAGFMSERMDGPTGFAWPEAGEEQLAWRELSFCISSGVALLWWTKGKPRKAQVERIVTGARTVKE